MDRELIRSAGKYANRRKRKKLWQKVVGALGCIVVFCTTYALILPAITMEKEPVCGLPEHQHDESCYAPADMDSQPELLCTIESLNIHQHEADCLDENGEPVCGYADFVVHSHGSSCYREDGSLWCPLPEIKTHVHEESCFSVPESQDLESHIHTEECYILQQGERICTEEVLEEHSHSEACYDENGGLVCPVEESLGHQHTEDCYDWEKVLICERSEEPEEDEPAEAELLCEQKEIVLHQHGADCFDKNGLLICGKTQVLEHIHAESCFQTAEASPEPVLICEQVEHQHTEDCFKTQPEEETQEVWEATLPALTGNRAEDVIAIARSQLGYTESADNVVTLEDGSIKGYTRYGAWYGDAYGDWDAMFASFCLHYAQVDSMPLSADSQSWMEALNAGGIFSAAGEEAPNPGDLIFFDGDGDGLSDHVGLVEEVLDGKITTIEGDLLDQVASTEYDLSDPTVLGYGILPSERAVVTRTAVIYSDERWETLADDSTIITVTGMIPEEAEVRAFPVAISTEQPLLCAYDIAIVLPDGTVFEPEEGEILTVSIQPPDFDEKELGENQKIEVYYVPEEGEPEPVEATVTEEGVSFDTSHFSVYMVLAVDGTQVGSADELKTAVTNGSAYIQLSADFTVSESLTLPSAANVTLDLNGHVLTASGSGALFIIPANTSLTITDSLKGAESITSASADSAGKAASVSSNTLTYYVTTTRVSNGDNGATTESLEKHSIRFSGSIVGGSQPVFSLSGGTLNLESGVIRGGTGRAIAQTGGTANLNGGYICGFSQSSSKTDNTSFGGAIRASGGSLNLSGTVLAANTAHNGGAIYATGSTKISIIDGAISGNTANRTTSGWNDHSESGAYRCGGGGIYADENVEIVMSDGYITNNIATHNGYFDGGGGICLSGTASMALSGGYVTGNQAQGGGGIRTDFGKETTFVMTGGFVSANVATHSEGGGIAIDRNGVGTITGGYITNNQIPNTGHWGGGGLFCADGSTLNLKNTLITENTAGGFGGGVAGCPTGNLYLYVTEGCAIYDNRDSVDGDSPHFTSDGVKQIDKEICTEVFQANGHADYFCALNSTVTGTMLGNNAANWQGSADYNPVIADAEDLLAATRVMGLEAHPTNEAKTAAESAAKVYINGNYSYTHGGGIMCNGNLVIGIPHNIEVPSRVQLQATKQLLDGSGNSQSLAENDFSFHVTMTEPDGTVIASGVCDSSGKITFDHQLTFKQEGTFVYYIYEEAGTDASIRYDKTLYRLTVTVKKDNGVAWYGDTMKYTYTVTSVKVESSADGETWTQISQNNSTQSGVITLPLTSGTTFTNRIIQPTKITVQKKWEGGSGADSVTVILKKDGEETDRRILNAENGWTYTWSALESGHTYTVEEVPVDGYTSSYEIITSSDSSESASLGQGSWWVPATELKAGQQYLIVSPDGAKALHVASGGEGDGFNTADVTSVTQQNTSLTINGRTYSSWYQAADIPARSIYNAETLARNSHSGIVLKRSDGGSYPYLRLESNNNNYLKGASSTDYASFLVFDGTYLKGHNTSEWTPDNLRTIIYGDGKFNSTTEQSPSNAAKLYTLVSGEAFTGTITDSSTVIITNTRDNSSEYELPETGGSGTNRYIMGGLLLTGAALLLLYKHTKRGKEDSFSL